MNFDIVSLGGEDWPRIPSGREVEADIVSHGMCPDYGAGHGDGCDGCDVEQCPVCGLQLLACKYLDRHEEKGSGMWGGHPFAGQDPRAAAARLVQLGSVPRE